MKSEDFLVAQMTQLRLLSFTHIIRRQDALGKCRGRQKTVQEYSTGVQENDWLKKGSHELESAIPGEGSGHSITGFL